MLEKRNLNYFSAPSFLKLDVAAGVIRSRGGTRMLAVSEDFLRGFVTACEHEAGKAAPLILRRCGTFFGARLARRFEAEIGSYAGVSLRDRSMLELNGLMEDLWNGCGYGQLTIDWSKGSAGIIPIVLENSPMQDIGPKGHTADDLFCGIFEGFIGHFAESGMRCVQTGDRRLGDKEGTTFILGFEDTMGRITGLLADKQPHSRIVARLSGG
jgi:predicted hydrocarbon binding protein